MRFVFWLGIIVMTLLVSGCSSSKSWSWKQKLTIEVETPDGLVTGFSISRVKSTYTSAGPAKGGGGEIVGEAVVVEVAQGKYLFVLMDDVTDGIAKRVFGDLLPKRVRGDPTKLVVKKRNDALSNLRESRPVPPELYPMLVTFDDITDPTSVKLVDPDDLASSFGAGYKLKSILLEITDEKVTTGRIESVLGWLGEHPEPTLGRSSDIYNPIFAATVKHGDFIRR